MSPDEIETTTRDIYDYFRFLYEDEEKRFATLIERGKIFFGLVPVYAAFLAFTIENNLPVNSALWVILATAAALLLMSLILSLLALRIMGYEEPSNPEDMIDGFGDDLPTPADFLQGPISDLAVAYGRNVRTNERRAWMLSLASWTFVAGLMAHTIYFLLNAYVSSGGSG